MDRRDFIKKATMAAAATAVVLPVSAMINTVAGKQCKVLLINGSPRTDGNTFCCLQEIEATLQKHGIETEIVQNVHQLWWMSSARKQGLRVRR